MLAALLLNLADYSPPEPPEPPAPEPEAVVDGAGSGGKDWARWSGRTRYANGTTQAQALDRARAHVEEIERKKRERLAVQARQDFRVIKGGRPEKAGVVALKLAGSIESLQSASEAQALAEMQAMHEDDLMAVLMIVALMD